jgi:hypothetical protein
MASASSGSLEVVSGGLLQKFRERPQVSSLLPGQRGWKAAARVLSEAAEGHLNECFFKQF